MRVRSAGAVLTALVVLWGSAASAAAAYPDDPGYAPAERAGECPRVPGAEQHGLYSFLPRCTPNAKDPEGASGMSVDAAWRDYTTGSPDVTIAYVEGGINWHNGDAAELADKVFLNTGELPKPQGAASHDKDGDGAVTAADYAGDPRVEDANGNGRTDPEDLIAAFSDGRDDDGNGFTDDISGWDFYDRQNDPATYDSTYDHANNQMRTLAAQTNNGVAGAGVCPRCRVLPVRAGQEALDRTDDLAQAWLYAARMGAKVIVSTTADLGYSAYMRQTVEKLWRQGVVMVESSNDFDSTDHQGGMFWPHVVPGNGLVANSAGVPGTLANTLTTTYRARSGLTSFGAKAMFSVSTGGGSTSESTPTTGGVFGLLLSYGLQIGKPLTGDEAVQVLRATASDIADPSLPWPGRPGWDRQYGYGRPNVAKALKMIKDGAVPPTGSLTAPDWYALYDPQKTKSVRVTGHIAAPRSSGYRYELQWAPGIEPADKDFRTGGSGTGTAPRDGALGTLDLSKVPESVWNSAYKMPTDKALSETERYTVTLRLRVWDAAGRMSEDRRAVAVHHDPALRTGFPIKLGIGNESQPALADLRGDGHQAIVYGDGDGRIHARDGVTGAELPGWPATTRPTVPQAPTPGVDPGHEPVIAPVAIGDLDHDGRPEVVATSSTGRTYAFDAAGKALPGWPKTLDAGVAQPAIPRPALKYTRLPAQGATASPVLADLDGDKRLEIVQAGWDGRLHAWHADGTTVPGWPVEVRTGQGPPEGYVRIDDHKLPGTPAVADLDGDGKPEIVVRSQRFDTKGGGEQFYGAGYVFAYHADGRPVANWPVRTPSTMTFYGSAQEFVTEGVNQPAVADVDGDGRDEVATGPSFAPTYLIAGTGKIVRNLGPLENPAAGLNPAAVLKGNLPADVPLSFTTTGAFGRFGPFNRLGYTESGSGAVSLITALLFPGSGQPIGNYQRGYDAATGLPVLGYPQGRTGIGFLGAPIVADVTGDGRAEVVDGGDTSTLHAFGDLGQAAGFPRFTGGWMLWSPTAGDLDGDGRTDLVATTREGYLFAWRTAGRAAANAEWWTYHHDEWRTGRYGVDSRPPGALRGARRDGTTVTFTAPGDDWYTGRPASYLVTAGGRTSTLPATRDAGAAQALTVPAGTVRVQAADDAGNVGPAVTLP
ncbi:FG-GAP-like repeat-containing protein [Actinomadura parmotrematis]|uniref:FG-GAP-like repeat-containing protein n=1 Tax=Actinomadura parmotrematis TaxID=2864039 RepID=A0ABS7FSX2_9ACTN|nr:FG-GAP-like repeat-containing protein [Actinomadura parmotrematis]MBW8483498.1 FG-GAP-like repeat-containing protein [Actinomadura parmotrematis]